MPLFTSTTADAKTCPGNGRMSFTIGGMLCILVPTSTAAIAGLKEGDYVTCDIKIDGVVIAKTEPPVGKFERGKHRLMYDARSNGEAYLALSVTSDLPFDPFGRCGVLTLIERVGEAFFSWPLAENKQLPKAVRRRSTGPRIKEDEYKEFLKGLIASCNTKNDVYRALTGEYAPLVVEAINSLSAKVEEPSK